MIDGRIARGDRTRAAVLDAAVAIASVDGLEAMSLARLADATGVSKSGLFAHWPDKESLQLAVVAHAVRQWTEQIVSPALAVPRGVRRLWALHELRMAFYAAGTLPGGCFFVATAVEFDDRPGRVREAIAAAIGDWRDLLRSVAGQAVEAGELRPETDIGQLVFEIQALADAAVTSTRLFHAEPVAAYARKAVLDRLRALSATPELLPEELPMDGVIEPVQVHFEDLDAMGVVHNGRYVLLLERALAAFWARAGWAFDPAEPHFKDVFFVVREFTITYDVPITRVGPVHVQLWLDHLGSTSAVYGFRVMSEDETVTHAQGRRVQVRLDPATLRPAVIGPQLRAACRPLQREAAAQGFDARVG